MENSLIWQMSRLVFKSHPWHGVPIGEKSPKVCTAYIELVPGDTVKYEVDKYSGYLKIDRPQLYSSVCPSLYGLLPQTYSGERVAEYCRAKTGIENLVGDHDPLDICVLTEKLVPYGDVLLNCRPIGGFRMLDGGEVDDKIIAVMYADAIYRECKDIADIPKSVINRLKHYFLTYKQNPDSEEQKCEIVDIYGKAEAYEIIKLAREDYDEKFPGMDAFVKDLRG
jgi:inorganic pyrophosphatase